MPEKFDVLTASKEECLAKAEAEGLAMPEGSGRDTKFCQVEFALKNACKTELAAFDGRQ